MLDVDQTWHRDGRPDRAQALGLHGLERAAGELAQPVEHVGDGAAAVVGRLHALVARAAGEVGGLHADVVDVDLQPERDHAVARDIDHQAGRPAVPRCSAPRSTSSPKSISSETSEDTVLLFRPVSVAIVARERGPRSTTWRSTTHRLCRRTARWLESSIAGFGVHMRTPSLSQSAAAAATGEDRRGGACVTESSSTA